MNLESDRVSLVALERSIAVPANSETEDVALARNVRDLKRDLTLCRNEVASVRVNDLALAYPAEEFYCGNAHGVIEIDLHTGGGFWKRLCAQHVGWQPGASHVRRCSCWASALPYAPEDEPG